MCDELCSLTNLVGAAAKSGTQMFRISFYRSSSPLWSLFNYSSSSRVGQWSALCAKANLDRVKRKPFGIPKDPSVLYVVRVNTRIPLIWRVSAAFLPLAHSWKFLLPTLRNLGCEWKERNPWLVGKKFMHWAKIYSKSKKEERKSRTAKRVQVQFSALCI